MDEPKTLVGDVKSSRLDRLVNSKSKLSIPLRLAKRHPRQSVLLLALLLVGGGAAYYFLRPEPLPPPKTGFDIFGENNVITGNLNKEAVQKGLDNRSAIDTSALNNDQKFDHYLQMGLQQKSLNQNDKALQSFEQALALRPTEVTVLSVAASTAEALGDKAKAKDYYLRLKAAYQAMPQNEQITRAISDIDKKVAGL